MALDGSYTLPVSADLIARYPEFVAVPTATINAVMAEASRSVDQSWLQGDFQFAILALTAHLLALSGVLGSEGVAGVSSDGPVISRKAGDTQLVYLSSIMAKSIASGSSNYWRTPYGQSFAVMLARSSPGVLAVM